MLKLFLLAFYALHFLPHSVSASTEMEIPDLPVKVAIHSVEINGQTLIALNFENAPYWHTYWKNPGDAGLPISIKFFESGRELQIEEFSHPIPQRYIEKGNIMAFGHDGSYDFFFLLTDELKNIFRKKSVTVSANWLVCRHICIPGKKQLIIDQVENLNFKSSQNELYITEEILKIRAESAPKSTAFPDFLDLNLVQGNEATPTLYLYYNLGPIDKARVIQNMNLLTPYPVDPFGFKREELFYDQKNNLYGRYKIEWDGEYMEPEIPLPGNGVFQVPYLLKFLFANPVTQKIEIIEKSFSTFPTDRAEKLNEFTTLLTPYSNQSNSPLNPNEQGSHQEVTLAREENSHPSTFALFTYLLLAFIGGLILNIMPCVLPVISLKLFGLVKHSQESGRSILKHNTFYSLGILTAFALLAIVIITLKGLGQSVGWGFQLQSPHFVAIMAIVIFVMALNLFGLFEFKTPGGNKIGNIEVRNTYSGDFLSGILATILSTPCSAPFLGTALTFAFTSGPMAIFLIFFFVGLGLAFPFILTGLFPKLVAFLPRPGAWMEHFKKWLALTLILTVMWLLDVFSSQVPSSVSVLKIQSLLIAIFFTFYFIKNISSKRKYILILTLLCFFMGGWLFKDTLEGEGSTGMVAMKQVGGLNWRSWSVEELTLNIEQHKPTFIDFTAKWCFTCKVNEKIVLDTAPFKDFVMTNGIDLLLADWTKRDPVIEKWLRSKGKVGVPAYFVVNSQGELIDLGETISLAEIKKAFNIRP